VEVGTKQIVLTGESYCDINTAVSSIIERINNIGDKKYIFKKLENKLIKGIDNKNNETLDETRFTANYKLMKPRLIYLI
jgi:hypothetical protein